MKKWLLAVLFLILLPASFAQVVLNEILPNPDSDWNNNSVNETYDDEWVELYNKGNITINLNNWLLGDKVKNYTFSNISLCSDCFLVLYGSNTSLQLNNNDEEIFLYNSSGNLIYNYSYSSSSKDFSFGRCGENWNSSLTPTPGAENNCSGGSSNCDLSVSIDVADLIYRYEDEIEYKLKVTDLNCQNINHNYSIEYWIETLFSTYIKDPYTSTYEILCSDTSSHQKKAPTICGSEVYYIEAEIIAHGCNDSNPSNDFAQQLIIIKGRSPTSSSCEESSSTSEKTTSSVAKDLIVKILEAPTNATQGEIISIKVNITNNYDSAKTIQVYSYIYEGQKLISEGGWTGNRQEFTLVSKSTKTLELKNTIKQDALLGAHTLKVRAKVDEKNIDEIQSIDILEGKILIQEEETENETKEEVIEKEPVAGELITGAVIWVSDTNKSLGFAMLVFIAALLVLVFALLATLWSNKKTYKYRHKPKKHG